MDDKSTLDFLGEQLDEYVKTLPIDVQVLRMKERSGIVAARLRGAEYAKVTQLIHILCEFNLFCCREK